MIDQLRTAAEFALQHIDDASRWGSLVIDRRQPHTWRVFAPFGELRICLHRFAPCEAGESFAHPHPWPSAMLVLSGVYQMSVAHSADLRSDETSPVLDVVLGPGSQYAMTEPGTWHQVVPRTECFSLMINGPRWEQPHRRAPTTSGKGLTEMSATELGSHLGTFKRLIGDYLSATGGR